MYTDMENQNHAPENLKIIFSLISVLLMMPMLVDGADEDFFKTLFIFLINRIMDMLFQSDNYRSVFFSSWKLINRWVGVVACAIAFSSILPKFSGFLGGNKNVIAFILFLSAISCVARELIELVVISIKEDLVKNKISKKNQNKRRIQL